MMFLECSIAVMQRWPLGEASEAGRLGPRAAEKDQNIMNMLLLLLTYTNCELLFPWPFQASPIPDTTTLLLRIFFFLQRALCLCLNDYGIPVGNMKVSVPRAPRILRPALLSWYCPLLLYWLPAID